MRLQAATLNAGPEWVKRAHALLWCSFNWIGIYLVTGSQAYTSSIYCLCLLTTLHPFYKGPFLYASGL